MNPKEKAEWYRKLDSELLPLLREVMEGSTQPELQAYEYDSDMWALAMEWVEDHATIALLRWLKTAEPPAENLALHDAWERTYKDWSDRFKGFAIARSMGKFESAEVVYFVVQLLERTNQFSAKGLRFLRVKEREHLGEAELPEPTETVLVEREEL
jgi:hypothetical protein